MLYPKLLNNWKIDRVFMKDNWVVLESVHEDFVSFFYWDGASSQYNRVEIYPIVKTLD